MVEALSGKPELYIMRGSVPSTYHKKNNTDPNDYYSPYAYALASTIGRNLSTLPGTVNRGVHPARFRVLRNVHYPSVLVECGYLSNRSEARDVADGAYREMLAEKIAQAIVDYRYGRGMYHSPPATVARAGGGASFLPSVR